MDLNDVPLFSLLQNKLGYLGERQRIIAQNVANSSTPGFTPQDLKPFNDQPGMKAGPRTQHVVAMGTMVTDAAHLAGSTDQAEASKPSVYASVASPDSETTLDGNQVVLEEQMMKMSDARNDYDAAVGFYQKALAMLHMAVQKPGG
jgi:flagellar basal-body rod protein FlgB